MQMADEDIENMMEAIKVGDRLLNIREEGRIQRCYKCDMKDHIRTDCPPPHPKTKER